MSVTYVVEFEVRPEKLSLFSQLLRDVLDRMRHESTFIEAKLLRNPEHLNAFKLVETWANHDNVVQVQIQRPYRAELNSRFDELLASPRKVSTWEEVRSDRNEAAHRN